MTLMNAETNNPVQILKTVFLQSFWMLMMILTFHDMEITNSFLKRVPQPVPQDVASRDESTPMFRWPMSRGPQPVGDFESPMRRFMEEGRYPSRRETVPERSQERDVLTKGETS